MRVIGIDPGLSATGFGIIDSNGTNNHTTIAYGTIKTSSKKDIPSRLQHIYRSLLQVLDEYLPVTAGVERIFVGKDPKNHLHMGEARGAIFLALKERDVEIHEFSALQVKKSITGYGGAQKSQVAYMVSRLLKIDGRPDEHASDALAIAMAVMNQNYLQIRCGNNDRSTLR